MGNPAAEQEGCLCVQTRKASRVLAAAIVALARRFGRNGYRPVTASLKRMGLRVNHKRVECIWRREGLGVLRMQPERGRLWLNDRSYMRLRPQHLNDVWAYDFVADRTHDGRGFRLLVVIDEHTRDPHYAAAHQRRSSDA